MAEQYNTKNAGVRRLMKEAMELRLPTEMYHAQPIEDNLFEWHFTIRGTLGSDFEGGIYHGRIIFPVEYPMKPPNMILLTPNGRFELNKKICLSISGYHPETWLPSWSIRTALLALIGFLPSQAGGALGSLEYPPPERKRLAKLSVNWKCKECGCLMKDALLPITEDGQLKQSEEAKNLAAQLKFQDESVVKKEAAEKEKQETQKSDEKVDQKVSTEPDSSTSENTQTEESVEDSSVEESEIESPVVAPEVPEEPIVTEAAPSSQIRQQNRNLPSRSYYYFVTIPITFCCFIIFFTLLARRFLIDNGNSEL